jgi:hypothetical protein
MQYNYQNNLIDHNDVNYVVPLPPPPPPLVRENAVYPQHYNNNDNDNRPFIWNDINNRNNNLNNNNRNNNLNNNNRNNNDFDDDDDANANADANADANANHILINDFINILDRHNVRHNEIDELYEDIDDKLQEFIYGRNIYNLVDDLYVDYWSDNKILILLDCLRFIAQQRDDIQYIEEIDEYSLTISRDAPPLLCNLAHNYGNQ